MKKMNLWIAILILIPAHSMEQDSSTGAVAQLVNGIETLDSNVYQKKIAEDLYLVMERTAVTKEGLQRWKSLAKTTLLNIEEHYGEEALYEDDSAEYSFYRAVYETFDIYKPILNWNYKKSGGADEVLQVWIAQALDTNYTHLKYESDGYGENHENNWYKHVEMTMFVVFYPADPFQMHIGISRNIFYKGVKHSHLSLQLHSFAAQVTCLSNPRKIYMVTRPLYNMWSILVENLPKNSYQEQDHPNGWIQEIPNDNAPSQWLIKDLKGETILVIDDSNRIDYKWLLREDWDLDLFTVNLERLTDIGMP
ncbi:MAG: hypothetical protein K0M45_03845 [Candidatus Paracaedibacteraceae bacterium]|nr:hypothetical protein [Candidatus Paracaedibacteraceae bacterium]